MGGRYGGDIKGRRRGASRTREPWTPPKPKEEPRQQNAHRWALVAALGVYAVMLGMLPLFL